MEKLNGIPDDQNHGIPTLTGATSEYKLVISVL
jgi:hypothetical protein